MHTDSQYDHAPSHHALMRLRPENSVFLCFEKRQIKLVVRNSFEEIKLADGEVTISKKWGNSKNFIEVAFSTLSKPVAACIHRLLIVCFQPLRKEVHEKSLYDVLPELQKVLDLPPNLDFKVPISSFQSFVKISKKAFIYQEKY